MVARGCSIGTALDILAKAEEGRQPIYVIYPAGSSQSAAAGDPRAAPWRRHGQDRRSRYGRWSVEEGRASSLQDGHLHRFYGVLDGQRQFNRLRLCKTRDERAEAAVGWHAINRLTFLHHERHISRNGLVSCVKEKRTYRPPLTTVSPSTAPADPSCPHHHDCACTRAFC